MRGPIVTFAMLSLFSLGLAFTASASIVDTFDSIDPAWVTDRYEPDAFVSEPFLGDNRLRIGISTDDSAANRPLAYVDPFYNTQGRQRTLTGIGNSWTMSAEIFLSSDMTDGNNLRRTDLWARTGLVGDEMGANYPIIGVRRFDPSDPFNSSASGIASVWRVWDPENGGWQDLGSPTSSGFYLLEIASDGSSYEYSINGSTVYTDTTVNGLDLTTVFLQAYNFGNENYSVYWDNLNVAADGTIPEPLSVFAWGGLIGCAGVAARRYQRSTT